LWRTRSGWECLQTESRQFQGLATTKLARPLLARRAAQNEMSANDL
jgi:hypothetical protein